MKGPKQPKTEFHPNPRKIPRSEPLIEGLPLAWRFSSADRDGPWSISKLFGDSRLKDVLLRLLEFESKTWNDIERTGSIRHANIMRLLWWDPEHQVCPALKKHT